jgi:hypothetical protein
MQVSHVQPSVASRPRWWLWPTILSLDAPAVVVLWQVLIARSASAGVSPAEAFVLGSSVWLAYAADRWIEGWRLIPENIRTHRHRFYQRWRWPIMALWMGVLALDLAAAVRGLAPASFRGGLLLLIPVTAYLLSHQLIHRKIRLRAPKEACVALLLAGGAAVFAASRPGADIHAMAVPVILFVLLCFANCALISVWENEVDRSHGQTSLALQFSRAAAVSRALPWLIFVLAAAIRLAAVPHANAAAACAAASGVLLGLVDLAERRVGWVAARVLADVALMTPLAWLLLRTT